MKHAASRQLAAAIGIAAICLVIAGVAQAMQFAPWSTAVKIDETNGNHVDLTSEVLRLVSPNPD